MRCSATEIKKYALEMIEDSGSIKTIREHLMQCPDCSKQLEQELYLNKQLKRLPKVIVPLDFSMAVMQQVRIAAGVPSSRKKSWMGWSLAAAAVLIFTFITSRYPGILNTPLWDNIIIGSFGLLVHTLESGIRASMAVGHASVLTLQTLGSVLTYFARISLGVPSFWFTALASLFVLSYTALYLLLRKQEHRS